MAALEEVGNFLYSQHQKVFPQISVSLKIKQTKKSYILKATCQDYYSPLKTFLTSVPWYSPVVTPLYSVSGDEAGTARVSGPVTSSHDQSLCTLPVHKHKYYHHLDVGK